MSELKALMMAAPGTTLSVAESLTCGRLQSRIGAISGASNFFLGGLTAYSLEQKISLLGVDRAEAVATNCVSEKVAVQMARGVRKLFGSDVGVATTGYAEPSPEQGVTDPFAWWAVCRGSTSGEPVVMTGRVSFPGLPRVEVQERVAQVAYDALLESLRAPAAR
ncbi:MAG TPA: CinA family protein [Opitutaceae bacterium]|nr:CinA family protein [Opitutaceae bacterium]